jgi:iron complex outermembrane receptor protein
MDINRVEVARGPQGTVQGRNSTAGTINYYTNRPTTDGTHGSLALGYGSYAQVESNGFLNLPLSDKWAVRAAFSSDKNNGWVRNINPTSAVRRLGLKDMIAGRLSAQYKDDFATYYFKAEYGRFGPVAAHNETFLATKRLPGVPGVFEATADALGESLTSIGATNPNVVNKDTQELVHSEMQHYYARGDWHLSDKLQLTGVTGWLRGTKWEVEDCDNGPQPLCLFSNNARSEHWTAELRAFWAPQDNFRLTGGVNALNQHLSVFSTTPLFFNQAISGTLLGLPGQYVQSFHDVQDLKSWAVFAQPEFDLSPHWTAIVGARYTKDKKELNGIDAVSVAPFGTPSPVSIEQFDALGAAARASHTLGLTVFNPSTVGDQAIFDKGLVNANAQLNFKPSRDVLAYIGYRRGVKSGGFATGNVAGFPASARKFKEEVNNAYELGIKSTLLDHRLRANAALFYYDYKDMQNTSFVGITNVITNNDAKVKGGEIELAAVPVKGLDLALALGAVDTTVYGIHVPDGSGAVHVLNNQLPLAPKFTANARARYTWPAFSGSLFAQGALRTHSSQFRDSQDNQADKMPSITVFDAIAGFTSQDGSWTTSLEVDNVFDTRKRINAFQLVAVLGGGEQTLNPPRWLTFMIKHNF